MSWVGTPSTIYSGSLFRKEEKPLILTLDVSPGWPLPITITPDARPCKRLLTFPAGTAVRPEGPTNETDPDISFLVWTV